MAFQAREMPHRMASSHLTFTALSSMVGVLENSCPELLSALLAASALTMEGKSCVSSCRVAVFGLEHSPTWYRRLDIHMPCCRDSFSIVFARRLVAAEAFGMLMRVLGVAPLGMKTP